MADPTVISVDPPPTAANSDHGLPIPPLDDTFFSQQLEDDANLWNCGPGSDMGFNIDDIDLDLDFDIDQLLNPNQQQPHPESSFFASDYNQFNSNSQDYCDGRVLEENNSSNGSVVLSDSLPGKDSNHFSGYVDARSPESNGSNGKGDAIGNRMSWPSPESQASGNCRSDISTEVSNNPEVRAVSATPISDNIYSKVGVGDEKIKLDGSAKKASSRSSLLKRKKDRQEMVMDNNNINTTCAKDRDNSQDNRGLSDGDEKKKARLMRNRESAQLSRQRKKHYVEELEDKVKSMNATIQDLNMKVSYFMAENANLRQQVAGAGVGGVPPMVPPVPGMYPQPTMMYNPWMPYAPPYMVKSQGSQVPLVPIPRLKPQQPAQAPRVIKKVDNKKNEGQKVKKVAGVSFMGLLFFMLLFGGLVPMVDMRYGGFKEAFSSRQSYVGGGHNANHHGRVLTLNGTDCGGKREFGGNSSGHCVQGHHGNGSEPLTASLYVPRNDKLVKIDGNLIIHSVLASEKAMASRVEERDETGLAVLGDLAPVVPVTGVTRSGAGHPQLRALGSGSVDKDGVKSSDGKMHGWFLEGLAGPMLTSGMCTEVFQFDVSSAIVPATTKRNSTEERNQNSTQLTQGRNRRILYDHHPIPLPDSSLNISREPAGKTSHRGNMNENKNSSSMVVSVLVDPREAGDGDVDGVLGPKSLSRIFVVVLVDSVKYVTYSCMLPFKSSSTPHLVTT